MSAPTMAAVARPVAGTAGLPPPLRQAAKEFEATVAAAMLRALPFDFAAGDAAPLADLLIDQYAKLLTAGSGLGLADAVGRELLQLQGRRP